MKISKYYFVMGVLLFLFGQSVKANTISLQPSSLNISTGDSLEILINADITDNLQGYQIDVGYNQILFQFVSFQEDSSFSGNNYMVLPVMLQQTNLLDDITLVRMNGGLNGNYTLGKLTFIAIDEGISFFNLQNVMLADSSGEALNNVEILNTSVNVYYSGNPPQIQNTPTSDIGIQSTLEETGKGIGNFLDGVTKPLAGILIFVGIIFGFMAYISFNWKKIQDRLF